MIRRTRPFAGSLGRLMMASLLLVSAAGCGQEPAPAAAAPAATPKAVRVTPVVARPADRYIEITGTLFGEEEVSIAAKVPGRVMAIDADLGDAVAPGGKLLEIDPVDYRLAVEEQRAALSAALAKVGLMTLPEAEPDLTTLPVVARAMAEESNARARLDRARKLYERQPPLISEQDFADIRTQYEVASTSAAVERLNAGSLIAEARVRASALRAAEQRLADTQVVSPVQRELTYRVAERMVSVGEIVAAGQVLFRLVASDRVKFRGMAPERYSRQIRIGASARLQVDSSEQPFEASVTRVAPAVDVASRSFEMEIGAANPDGVLKPGSFVRARVLVSTQPDARFVPESAVMQFAGVQRVFSIKDGKVVEHRVELGPVENGMREWLQPVEGVDEVIDQPRGLRAGQPVTVDR